MIRAPRHGRGAVYRFGEAAETDPGDVAGQIGVIPWSMAAGIDWPAASARCHCTSAAVSVASPE